VVSALALRDAGGVAPAFLLLIYPSTEILSERPSRQRYGEGFFLDKESLEWFFRRYLPDGNTEDWRASPMRADSLAGLPPMLLISAECDPLVDDCAAFAARVSEERGEIEQFRADGMVHGFITLGKFFPQANVAVAHAAGALHKRLFAPA
jgi:acetyl esterase